MRKMDLDGLTLCAIQADVFERSIDQFSCSSDIFIKRFTNSRMAPLFDGKSILNDSYSTEAILNELRQEFGSLSYGSIKYSQNEMYWIGYTYRYFCYTYDLSLKQVYRIASPAEMRNLYLPYHTLDCSQAIERILEAKGIALNEEAIINKGISILRNIHLKEKLRNVYFLIGNACAGKSTMVRLLADKHNGIALTENYHNELVTENLDKSKYPALCYVRDLEDWSDFVTRTPDEYEEWVKKANKECEELELKMLGDLENDGKLVFVDSNISIKTLHNVADNDHVLVMLAEPEMGVEHFFEREDEDKQFLYGLLRKEDNADEAISNFKECLRRVNSKAKYKEYLNSGFMVLQRDDNRSVEETLSIVEKIFHLD